MSSRLPSLGPRGEGWVVAQLVLFSVIAGAGLWNLLGQEPPGSPSPVGQLTGFAAIVVGGLVAGRGVWDLRASLSPFPRPVADAPLTQSGAYRYIRHPIYSGLVLGAIGWGVITGSIVAAGMAGVLFLLFAGKSRREEAWLAAVHPEYGDYQRRTKRLIPWIY
jgi:protein-S-isoprenylcysteine O-methyltransferase Ste14